MSNVTRSKHKKPIATPLHDVEFLASNLSDTARMDIMHEFVESWIDCGKKDHVEAMKEFLMKLPSNHDFDDQEKKHILKVIVHNEFHKTAMDLAGLDVEFDTFMIETIIDHIYTKCNHEHKQGANLSESMLSMHEGVAIIDKISQNHPGISLRPDDEPLLFRGNIKAINFIDIADSLCPYMSNQVMHDFVNYLKHENTAMTSKQYDKSLGIIEKWMLTTDYQESHATFSIQDAVSKISEFMNSVHFQVSESRCDSMMAQAAVAASYGIETNGMVNAIIKQRK